MKAFTCFGFSIHLQPSLACASACIVNHTSGFGVQCTLHGVWAVVFMQMSSTVSHACGSFGCSVLITSAHIGFRFRAFNLSGISGELSGSSNMVVAGGLLFHVLLLWGFALGFSGSRVLALNLSGIRGELKWL